MPTFRSYVALGDSFTEGVGDPDPHRPNGVRGWADRVAEVLASPVRRLPLRQPRHPRPQDGRGARRAGGAGARDAPRPGQRLRRRQRHPAAEGRRRRDRRAVRRRAAPAHGDRRPPGAVHRLRPRLGAGVRPAARPGRVYNELVREVADDTGATLVDFWRMREYRDPRMWDVDRIHMSSIGHQHMAVAVLDAPRRRRTPSTLDPLPELPPLSREPSGARPTSPGRAPTPPRGCSAG